MTEAGTDKCAGLATVLFLVWNLEGKNVFNKKGKVIPKKGIPYRKWTEKRKEEEAVRGHRNR